MSLNSRPLEWTPGDGWRKASNIEAGNAAERSGDRIESIIDGQRVWWVREKPVPPLPTAPHTVILTRSRKGWDDWEVKLDADGVLWRRTTKSDVTFEPDELARLIHGFEVLSEPPSNAWVPASVLDRVRDLLERTHQTRTLPEPVVRALTAAHREYATAQTRKDGTS